MGAVNCQFFSGNLDSMAKETIENGMGQRLEQDSH